MEAIWFLIAHPQENTSASIRSIFVRQSTEGKKAKDGVRLF
jgi:hypothetical protein